MKFVGLRAAIIATTTVLVVGGTGCSTTERAVPLSSAGVIFEKPVKTWCDFRDRNIAVQGSDYSCGSAALTTLMRYYFKDSVSEDKVLKQLWNQMSPEDRKDRKKNGFTLLDLQKAAVGMGYQAVGLRPTFRELKELTDNGPILIHVVSNGQKHFAILKGVREDRLYLADPTRGNIRLSLEDFSEEWATGTALVLGKQGFGTPTDHLLAIKDESPIRNEIETTRKRLFIRNR